MRFHIFERRKYTQACPHMHAYVYIHSYKGTLTMANTTYPEQCYDSPPPTFSIKILKNVLTLSKLSTHINLVALMVEQLLWIYHQPRSLFVDSGSSYLGTLPLVFMIQGFALHQLVSTPFEPYHIRVQGPRFASVVVQSPAHKHWTQSFKAVNIDINSHGLALDQQAMSS